LACGFDMDTSFGFWVFVLYKNVRNRLTTRRMRTLDWVAHMLIYNWRNQLIIQVSGDFRRTDAVLNPFGFYHCKIHMWML